MYLSILLAIKTRSVVYNHPRSNTLVYLLIVCIITGKFAISLNTRAKDCFLLNYALLWIKQLYIGRNIAFLLSLLSQQYIQRFQQILAYHKNFRGTDCDLEMRISPGNTVSSELPWINRWLLLVGETIYPISKWLANTVHNLRMYRGWV